MLDHFVDVAQHDKELMHLWNSFVRKQRYVNSSSFRLPSAISFYELSIFASKHWGWTGHDYVDKENKFVLKLLFLILRCTSLLQNTCRWALFMGM